MPESALGGAHVRPWDLRAERGALLATWGGEVSRITHAGASIASIRLDSHTTLLATTRTTKPELEFLSVRLKPLKADGRPWDLSFNDIPRAGWSLAAKAAGYPTLQWLSVIPHRNRPDPALALSLDAAPARFTTPVQGSFFATWSHLRLPLDSGGERLQVSVFDLDLVEHDFAGGWDFNLAALRGSRGLTRLKDSGQVHELRFVLRGPTHTELQPVVIQRVQVSVRPCNPQGCVWDGPYPLPNSVTDNRKVPEQLRGCAAIMRPDPKVVLSAPGQFLALAGVDDSYDVDLRLGAWLLDARPGSGEGLRLTVADRDEVTDDPIGDVFIPIEAFILARSDGRLVIQGLPEEGIERTEVTFRMP